MPVGLLTSFSHLRGLEHGVDDHVDILVLRDLWSQVLGEDDGDVDDGDDDDTASPIHLGVDEEEEVGHAQQWEQDQGCSHCPTDLERDVGQYINIKLKSSVMETIQWKKGSFFETMIKQGNGGGVDLSSKCFGFVWCY